MLEVAQRDRWIANTLAGLAEVATLRGDTERAAALLPAPRDDAVGVTDTRERLAALHRCAESVLSAL